MPFFSRLKARAYRELKVRLPAKLSIQLQYLHAHGCLANLRRPRTFNEKLQHRKLYEEDDRFAPYSDKIEAKRKVTELGRADILIPTLWSGTTLPPRAERRWPLPYVIKSNLGSGWNIFVRSREDEDWDVIEHRVSRWSTDVYKPYLHERFYEEIPPQVLVEPLIGKPHELPTDYKFYCFDGLPELITIQTERRSGLLMTNLDAAWRPLDLTYAYPQPKDPPPHPANKTEMTEIARQLAQGFSFVRIDLYNIGGRIYFGEFSFMPGSGFAKFEPATYDLQLGQLWKQTSGYGATKAGKNSPYS